MNHELAAELKHAGFPIGAYRAGHKFYPHEDDPGWTDAARRHGIILNTYDRENRLQDIRNGFYCPNLSDLIDACGKHFARLYIIKTIWTAEGPNMVQIAIGDSPEEAVAKLWLAVNKLKESNAESSAASGMSISTKPNDGRS
jgi:hypothetical protein